VGISLGREIICDIRKKGIQDFVKEIQNLVQLNRLQANLPKVTRLHFSVSGKVLEILSMQQPDTIKREEYLELVYDTYDFYLLQKGFWLLLRQDSSGQEIWRLRTVRRTDQFLECSEMTDEKAILAFLRFFTGNPCSTSIRNNCPCVAASLQTTRVKLNDNLWIDFSSWLSCGTSGLYVVGTSNIEQTEENLYLGDVRTIFEDEEIQCVPSKYFVCMKDIFPDAWKKAFNEQEGRQGTIQLDSYPVRRTKEPVYDFFHKLVTVEDLAKQLEAEEGKDEDD